MDGETSWSGDVPIGCLVAREIASSPNRHIEVLRDNQKARYTLK
jgi:hypothetical protein